MKILPGRRALRALLSAAAILAIALGLLSLPWRGERRPAPPRLVQVARGAGPLRAGAAAVPFELPAGAPIGGFARWSYESEGVRDPVGAHAVVLAVPGCKLALASADVLVVPEALDAAVRARVTDLRLDGLVVAATHTHAGPGGYWQHLAGERIATGPYDPRVRDAIAAGIAEAVRRADAALAPAQAAVARGAALELVRSRSGGPAEGPLTVVRLERDGGGPLAELVVFGAHPTILGKKNRAISGDWPGRFAADARHGTRVLLQGAVGDRSVSGPESSAPEAYADALSARAEALRPFPAPPAPELGFAAAEVALPAVAPGAAPALLRRAAANVAGGAFPATARVSAVRLGDLVLVAVPAEPVAAVARAWHAVLPDGAAVVSLADGYLGYVEDPRRMAEGAGETARTYFGPELAARLRDGVGLAAREVVRPSAAVPAGAR